MLIQRLRTARLCAALALVCARCLAASPSPMPGTAEEALAAAKRAAGGDAWNAIRTLHAVGTIALGGLSGKYESWVDLETGRYADRFELGPAAFAQGFDGARAWSADTSGQARFDDAEDSRRDAINEAYRRSFAFWIPGRRSATFADLGTRSEDDRRFRVARVTPDGGRPFEVWLDAATLRIDRFVEAGATATTTTTLSDLRPVAGVLVAHALRSADGEAAYDQRIVLTRVDANVAIAPAVFALPPPPPPDFSLAGGKTSTTVPFAIVNGHIALEVSVNGHAPTRIFCDTGGSNVIAPRLARELGVASSGALQGTGTGEGSAAVALGKIESLAIGEATIRNQVFAVFDLSPLEAVDGGPMPGIVGYELFKRFVVTIDYEHGRLTLTLPSAFHPPAGAVEVPFVFHGTKPQVQGSIDGIAGVFELDTGSRSSLDLTRPFVEEHDLARRYGATSEAITGWGIGGPVRSLLARAEVLTLGGIEIRRVVALLSRQTTGAYADRAVSGNVGAGVLRRFTLTFDYPGQRIFFARNASFDRPDVYERAGWWINSTPHAFELVDVIAGGPAAQAGLRVGDRIVAVDGRPVRDSDLSDFRQRLVSDPPGTTVRLTVVSGDGGPREVTLVLRDLV